jgi:hypothetical protein
LCYANLSNANLTSANLTSANLTDADLTGAHLNRADLRGANLTRANLTDAVLISTNLTDAVIRGSNLTCVNLTGVIIIGGRKGFEGAHLTGANFYDEEIIDQVPKFSSREAFSHFREDGQPKKSYATRFLADAAVHKLPVLDKNDFNSYQCGDHFHIGHSRK